MKKFYKILVALKKRILYMNIKNRNVQNLAYREYCYKKLYKKYKKYIQDHNLKENNQRKSNNVWICWFQGMENAPELVKKCYISAQKNLLNKKIIIITEENYSDYVDFPEHIIKKYKKGIIEKAHFSDLIRLELLRKYGGLWIDSTIFLTDVIEEDFFERDLFVYKNLSLYDKEELSVRASNWLLYSKSNNKIIDLTEKLLFRYWKDYNYAINYNIFHLFFTMATKKYELEWDNVPTYSNIEPHILQKELLNEFNEKRWNEIKKMSKIHKLNHRLSSDNKKTYYYHIINGDFDV